MAYIITATVEDNNGVRVDANQPEFLGDAYGREYDTEEAALRGPHGEIAEYLGPADYFGTPGATIRRRAGKQVVPASHIGTEWIPVPGRVVTVERATGRWNTPVETYLAVVDPWLRE